MQKKRSSIFTPYFLSILSGIAVYWTFGAMMVVSAGVSSIPIISFGGAIVHFGISSWLFLWLPKPGRIFALTTGVILILWPIVGLVYAIDQWDFFSTMFFLIPITFNGFHFYISISQFNRPIKLSRYVKWILTAIPIIPFVWYLVYPFRWLEIQ